MKTLFQPRMLSLPRQGDCPQPSLNRSGMGATTLRSCKRMVLAVILAGIRLCNSEATAANEDADLVALRAKLNGVWTVDAEKTKEVWGYKNQKLPPFLNGMLEGYQGNTFEFRPEFLIMNYAEGGKFVTTQKVNMQAKGPVKNMLIFEPDMNAPRAFVVARFTDTDTFLVIRSLGLTQLCIKKDSNASPQPYGEGFELTIPIPDKAPDTFRSTLDQKLSSSLKDAKLGLIVDVQYFFPEGLMSKDVASKPEAGEATPQKQGGSTPTFVMNSPTKVIYLLELYDPTTNRELLGRVLLKAGCTEDSELKKLKADSTKTILVKELLEKH